MEVLEECSQLGGGGFVLSADVAKGYEQADVQLHSEPQESALECSNGLGDAKVSSHPCFVCRLQPLFVQEWGSTTCWQSGWWVLFIR